MDTISARVRWRSSSSASSSSDDVAAVIPNNLKDLHQEPADAGNQEKRKRSRQNKRRARPDDSTNSRGSTYPSGHGHPSGKQDHSQGTKQETHRSEGEGPSEVSLGEEGSTGEEESQEQAQHPFLTDRRAWPQSSPLP